MGGGLKGALRSLFKRSSSDSDTNTNAKSKTTHPTTRNPKNPKQWSTAPLEAPTPPSPPPPPPKATRSNAQPPVLPPIVPSKDRLGPSSTPSSASGSMKPIPPTHPLATVQMKEERGVKMRDTPVQPVKAGGDGMRAEKWKLGTGAESQNGRLEHKGDDGDGQVKAVIGSRIQDEERVGVKTLETEDNARVTPSLKEEAKPAVPVSEPQPQSAHSTAMAQKLDPAVNSIENERPASSARNNLPSSSPEPIDTHQASPHSPVTHDSPTEHQMPPLQPKTIQPVDSTNPTERTSINTNGSSKSAGRELPPLQTNTSSPGNHEKMLAVEETRPIKTSPVVPGMSATSGPLEDFPAGF